VREFFLGKFFLPARRSDTFSESFVDLLHSRNCACMLSGQSTAYREAFYRVITLVRNISVVNCAVGPWEKLPMLLSALFERLN
jgi:hypothetical protein